MSEGNCEFTPSAYGKSAAKRIEDEANEWSSKTLNMKTPPLASIDQVPILDASGLITGEKSAVQEFSVELKKATFETGFYLLKGHGIDINLQNKIFEYIEKFRLLPEEVKYKYSQNTSGVGYVPLNIRRQPRREKGNMCECLYFKREEGPRDITWEKNFWPYELGRNFKSDMLDYFNKLENLSKALLPAYALLFGKNSDFFDNAFDRGLIRSRLAYYPSVDLEENQYGVAPHVDTTFITILNRKEESPGLCAATVEGKWVSIPNLPNHFTINTGELLKSWSNDVVVSTRHYANAGESDRYSIPFFWHPNADYIMDCNDFESFCNDRKPAKYKAFSYLESQGPAQGE